jgi:signal transduction histidine kinase/ligand-binding sensor domain-containing protein/CheY-like chemotaxis protein/HPt (histidine-containing phosphotransfer) domain-containing protein
MSKQYLKHVRVLAVAAALFISPGQCAYGADLDILSINLNRSVISEKLTQQSVRQSFQDSTGALWFVTHEGLNRYNGYELQNYRSTASDASSLPTDSITRMAEDHDGNLWLSTRGGGLVLYNPISDSFESLHSDPANSNSPYSNEISTIYTAMDGTLWLGYSNAFSKFNPKDRSFHHYISGSGNIPFTGRISSFTQTPDGGIWIATQATGLLRFEPNTGQLYVHQHSSDNPQTISSNWIWNITTDQKGNVWVATADAGVSRFDPVNKIATNFSHSDIDTNSLSSNQTSDIYEDAAGHIWIATSEGLNLFLAKSNSFMRYTSYNSGLPEDLVISVYQSREGNYWVGTLSGLATGMKTDFKKFDQRHGNLSNDSVNAFSETSDGSLWVGTDHGLNRLRPGATDFEWINGLTKPAIKNPKIMSLLSDKDSLWVGTYESGVNKIELTSGKVTHYQRNNQLKSSIGANGITSLLRLSTGQLLIGTYGGGLSLHQEISDDFINITHDPNDPSTISNNMVLSLYEDSLGFVWVGTEKGLNRFHPDTLEFDRYFVEEDRTNSFSSDMFMCFYEDVNGTLWIGTAGGGLNLWPAQDRLKNAVNIRHFSNNISLPSSNIYGIQGDDSGWVWVSHNLGLTRVNPQTLESRQYGVRDGLQAKEFTLGASFKSQDGTVYFGGVNGFNAIMPNFLTIDTVPPKVAISQIKVMNERREFDAPYHALESIELSYQDRMLSVEFFAADYSNPELVNYAYKLEGINPDWVVSPDARIASFTTLPSGTYNLKLAAATPDGTWNWDALSIPVVVAPPPWLSPIAYAAYTALAGALIGLYFYRQAELTRISLQRQRDLERRVEERTRDLDEARKIAVKATKAKSEFLATMSHEIRTPMHGIIGMTELLLHTQLNGQQQQFARAARKSGESLLNLINEILDFSKVEASKVELEHIGFNLTELIDDICYLQGEPAGRKGLQLNNICHPYTPSILMGDPTKIRQVVMNLVSNSIKFTHSGNVNIRVEPKFNPLVAGKALVHICVEDDGIGMDEETQKRVFEPFTQADTSTTREYGGTGLGLTISRHYIDIMGGDITIHSALGHGTKITLSIPLEFDPHCEPTASSFESLTARILASNLGTYQMVSSHLARLGVNSLPISEEDLVVTSDWANDIVVIDTDGERISSDLDSRLRTVNTCMCIFLMPLIGSAPKTPFSDWPTISKPITSNALSEVLSINLDSHKIFRNPESKRSKAKPLHKKQILVAEDVHTNQQIIVEIIRLLGHEVEIASNGQIAVEKFVGGEYSLIFMDCQMPVMDGYTATRKIRRIEMERNSQRVPIIALTAGSNKDDKDRCQNAGMDGYLTKPFSINDIQSNIEKHMRSEFSKIDSDLGIELINSEKVDDCNAIATDSKILDLSAIDNIRAIERQTGKQLLPAIFEGYVKQMEEKLKDIERNVITKDGTALFRTAHAIKSMSANIGADKVKKISILIEKKGKANEFSDLAEEIIALTQAYHEFLKEFDIVIV